MGKRLSPADKARAAALGKRRPPQVNFSNWSEFAAYVLAPEGKSLLPTQEAVIFDPERIKWLCGILGVGKTSTLVGSVLIPCLLYPGSTGIILRAVWWTLEQTTLKRFRECLDRLGEGVVLDEFKGPPAVYQLATISQDGTPTPPSTIIFTGLDELSKVASAEFDFVGVDEADEMDFDTIITLNQRLRARKWKQDRAEGPYTLTLVSNPPPRSHWLHQHFCDDDDQCEPVKLGKKFVPHPDENKDNLPPDYYEKAFPAGTPNHILRRLRYGECGPNPKAGEGVFKDDFNLALHVADLKIIPGAIGVRGWDFGKRRPACVAGQLLPDGSVNRLLEFLGHNELIKNFGQKVIMQCNARLAGIKQWIDYCDPHGDAKKDVSEKTSVSELRALGLNPLWWDHLIETRLNYMKDALNTWGNGRPKAMFDRSGCKFIIEGYSGGYAWPKDPPGAHQVAKKPKADGFYEHLMDADGYILVGLNHGAPNTDVSRLRKNLSRRQKER